MTQAEIYEDMLEEFQEQTGFEMAQEADLAVRLHAAAAQIEGLYAYADYCMRQAFPQTAVGSYLDYHGSMRDLTRRGASKATGTIRFWLPAVRTADIAIPQGTVCTTAGLVRFETTQAGAISAGSLYADVPAQAQVAGTAGNAGQGTIVSMTLAPVGVSRCTNPAAFSGGAEQEDDEAFRERILDSYRRLPNGANAAFYEERVLQTEGVAAVTVIPRYQGVGTVGVVVASPAGVPSQSLLTAISTDLNSVREIAVTVTVMAPQTISVNVTAGIKVAEGYNAQTVLTAARNAITGYFTGALLGQDIYLAKLGSLLYGVEGVQNYSLTAPTEDISITSRQLPVLGTLSITEVN